MCLCTAVCPKHGDYIPTFIAMLRLSFAVFHIKNIYIQIIVVIRTLYGSPNRDLTAAVVTCTKPIQNQTRQNPGREGVDDLQA